MKYLLILLLTCTASAQGKKLSEADYRDFWAKTHQGKTEVGMEDGTRCDVVTDTHAVEVEWANKWAEGIGQSLWYSFQTNKKAGLVLIIRNDKDLKHLLRVNSLIKAKNLNITVWTMGASSLQQKPKPVK